jgi:DNA-binding CsgD family transcriptional regulator
MSIFDIALDHERHRAEGGHLYGLNAYERALASLMVAGHDCIEAGRRLGMDDVVARRHRASLAGKLGANNEAELLHMLATLPSPGQAPQQVYVDDFRQTFGTTYLRHSYS